MKISIDDAGGELADLTDMRTQNFPPRLLRKPLRDRHNGYENSSSDNARDQEHIAAELARGGCRWTLQAHKRAHHDAGVTGTLNVKIGANWLF
jgi:hypothetical protein